MKKLLLSFSTLLVLCLSANNTSTIKTPKSVSAVGEALNFDGTDDYVITAGYSAFTEYTIETWVKLDVLTNQNIIAGTNNLGPLSTLSNNLRLMNGKFEHYLYDGAGKIVTSTVTVNSGVWYHVSISAKNNNVMKITVNGVETASTFSIGTSWNGLTQFRFGSNAISLPFFNGELDEVRIWNRQLCLDEINNNMNGEIATTATDLIGNYHFNQGVGGAINAAVTSLIDVSGFSHPSTLTNFTLNGTTSNWVNPGAIVSGIFVTPFASPVVSASGNTVVCGAATTTLTATGATSYSWSSGATTSTYVTTSNTTTTTYSVVGFVNNCRSNIATITVSNNPTPIINISDAYICIGNSYTLNPSGANTYTYSSGSSVITPTANTAVNITGTNMAGCVGSAVAIVYVQVCGQSGSSLNLDGINDRVNTPISLSPTTYQNWTFECWVNSPQIPKTTLGMDGPMYGENMGILWNHNSGFEGSAFVYEANGIYYVASFGSLAAHTWYHLAATYNGTELKTYRNGVLINTTTTGGSGLHSTSTTLKMGSHPSVANYFEGKIDEARIWNTVRSCTEINQSMNVELAGNESGLQAYYKFNEGVANGTNTSITTILDASSNANNGALSNFGLTGNSSNYFLGAPFNNPTNSSCLTTNVNEINSNTTFAIYPNPTNSILNIEVKEQTQISIINVLGEVLKTETITGASKLDVSTLNNGVYFIQDSKSGKAIKFIKE